MDTSMIHGLWKLVETTQAYQLINLGDNELIQLLSSQLSLHRGLSDQEAVQMQSYIGERIPLIRDIARGGF